MKDKTVVDRVVNSNLGSVFKYCFKKFTSANTPGLVDCVI